jgi:ligand-binding sensor domain-containing protein
LSTTAAWSVLAAKDSSVWLATSAGLNRRKDGQITVYRKRNGLPDDFVEALFEDARGRIWASTLHGLVYFENGRFTSINVVLGAATTWSDHSMFREGLAAVLASQPDMSLVAEASNGQRGAPALGR